MNYLLPISIVMGLIGYSLIARWYLWPWILRQSKTEALTVLILPHVFRYIGLAFLIHGVTDQPLDSRFAEPAAWGDLVASLLALAAVVLLKIKAKGALGLVWLFNLFGLLDLINAVFQGRLHVPDGSFGATYFIPAMIVPALVILHLLVFFTLTRRNKKSRLSNRL